MAIDYDDFIEDASSEKIVLAQIEPAQRLLIWEKISPTSTTYKKTVDFYVIAIEEEGSSLTEVASPSLIVSPGQWAFKKETKEVFVKTTGEVDPTDVFLAATYRLFFSNAPIKLPHDLSSTGNIVDYDPRLMATSKFGSFLENDFQLGIALEGDGTISLNNNDGYFDPYYDKLFWENKDVRVYATGRSVTVGDEQILYEGVIQAKRFRPNEIQFQLRDFITSLRNAINLSLFEEADGDIPEDIIGKPKRRIYGRTAGNYCVSVTQVLNGFDLTGTVSLLQDADVVTGTGTFFLDELGPEDVLFFTDEFDKDQEFKIKSIESDTSLTLAENPERGFQNISVKVNPKIPWRKRNRKQMIAGHPLRTPTTTITEATQLNRITVGSVVDIDPGDFIAVDVQGTDFVREVKRIINLEIVLRENLPGFPSVGATVTKPAVQRVDYVFEREERVFSKRLFDVRDYSVDNSGANPFLIIDDLAEFNVAKAASLTGDITFLNGSRIVTGVGTSFKTDLKSRDFINTGDTAEWYEILQVNSDTQLLLRTAFSTLDNTTDVALKKQLDIIDDKTAVIVDCYGKTDDNTPTGNLIRTGSDVVKDLLIEAGLSAKIDASRFAESDGTAAYLMSLKLPLERFGEVPIIRDVISLVNQSVFGNLHKTREFNIAYDVLAADKKPTIAIKLKDDDIIDFKVQTESQNIVKKTIVSYRHQDVSTTLLDPNATVISKESSIAEFLIKTERVQERDIYLYRDDEALTIMQRWAFLNEISQSVLKITAKPNLSNLEIGSVLFFNLDRLYTRFGSRADENKIGIVSGITQNGLEIELEVDDLSGWFFTVGTITENTADIFSVASVDDRAFNGYITDANELVDNLDFSYRINLIG